MNISKIISYVMVSALRAVMAVFSLGSFLPLQAHTGVCQIFIKCLIYQINSQYLPGSPFSSVCHDAKNENNPRTQSSSMSRSKVIKLSAYLNISPIYNSTKQRSWFSQSSKVAQYSSQQIILLLYKGNTVVLLALILIFFCDHVCFALKTVSSGIHKLSLSHKANIKICVSHFLVYFMIL